MSRPLQQHPTTFDKSHEHTCQQHRVLGVTMKQVVQSLGLKNGEEIPFPFPRKSTVLITAAEVAEAIDPEAYQTIHQLTSSKTNKNGSKSSPSSVLGYIGGYFGYGSSSNNNSEIDDEEEADRNWFQSDDDDDDNGKTIVTRSSSIQYDKTNLYHPIICRMCIQAVREKAIIESSDTIVGSTTDGTVIITLAEWETWISRPSSTSTTTSSSPNNEWIGFIATLPSSQKQFILKVLVELRYVQIMKGTDRLGATTGNQQNDVILFRGMAPFHGNTESTIDEDFQRKVALWDLNQQYRSLVQTREKYEQRRDTLLQKARQYKHEGNTKEALNMLRLSKQFGTRIATLYQQEANLQEVQMTIETMQFNEKNLAVMAKAAKVMKSIRENSGVSASDADEVYDELVAEMDLQQEITESVEEVTNAVVPPSSKMDDEALLDELKMLMDEGVETSGDSNDDVGGGPAKGSTDMVTDARVDELEQRLNALNVNTGTPVPTSKKGEAVGQGS